MRIAKSCHKTVFCLGCLLGGNQVHGMETSTRSTMNRHWSVRRRLPIKSTNHNSHAGFCEAVAHFGTRFPAKLSGQLGAPTEILMSVDRVVQRIFLNLAIRVPTGCCNPFSNVVRFAVFEIEGGASCCCILSKREYLEQSYVDHIGNCKQVKRHRVRTCHIEAKWDLVAYGV